MDKCIAWHCWSIVDAVRSDRSSLVSKLFSRTSTEPSIDLRFDIAGSEILTGFEFFCRGPFGGSSIDRMHLTNTCWKMSILHFYPMKARSIFARLIGRPNGELQSDWKTWAANVKCKLFLNKPSAPKLATPSSAKFHGAFLMIIEVFHCVILGWKPS